MAKTLKECFQQVEDLIKQLEAKYPEYKPVVSVVTVKTIGYNPQGIKQAYNFIYDTMTKDEVKKLWPKLRQLMVCVLSPQRKTAEIQKFLQKYPHAKQEWIFIINLYEAAKRVTTNIWKLPPKPPRKKSVEASQKVKRQAKQQAKQIQKTETKAATQKQPTGVKAQVKQQPTTQIQKQQVGKEITTKEKPSLTPLILLGVIGLLSLLLLVKIIRKL